MKMATYVGQELSITIVNKKMLKVIMIFTIVIINNAIGLITLSLSSTINNICKLSIVVIKLIIINTSPPPCGDSGEGETAMQNHRLQHYSVTNKHLNNNRGVDMFVYIGNA